QGVLPLQWHPTNLHVAKPNQSVRSPIFNCVWKRIRVYEGAPVLSGAELPQFAIGVAQTKNGLTSIIAAAEQLEFENSFQLAKPGGHRCLTPKSGLPDTKVGVPARRKLILEGRQFCRPQDVKIVGMGLVKLVTGIEHRKSVNLKRALAAGVL